MRIVIATPGTPETLTGNWTTARRWAGILEGLGHTVTVEAGEIPEGADLLVALHAGRSHDIVKAAREGREDFPIVVVLTGTDLYGGLLSDSRIPESLELATSIVVLQERGLDELPPALRAKARVIYQSAAPYRGPVERDATRFEVCVVASLRPEKDPLLAARAAELRSEDSRVHVTLIGPALDPDLATEAEALEGPRFAWRGLLPTEETRALMAGSDCVAITSRIEGSSNVLSEALVDRIPVLATAIPGLLGTLGENHPGLFRSGDVGALAELLTRAETDDGFLPSLSEAGERVRPRVEAATEIRELTRLLESMGR